MKDQKDKTTPQPVQVPGTRKGEEVLEEEGKEPGRHDASTTGAGRPAGGSTARDATGVNPEASEPIDPKSPQMPPA